VNSSVPSKLHACAAAHIFEHPCVRSSRICAPNTLQTWDDENVTQTVISEYSDSKFLVAGRIKAGLIQNFDDMANYTVRIERRRVCQAVDSAW